MPTTVVVPFPSTAPITPSGSAFETEVNRRNTLAYIDSDPSDIALQARMLIPDGEGGRVWTNLGLLAEQRVRMITQDTSSAVERLTVDGETVMPDVMMLMRWDASVERGYRFTWRSHEYEVVWVNEDFTYQKQVEVITRG